MRAGGFGGKPLLTDSRSSLILADLETTATRNPIISPLNTLAAQAAFLMFLKTTRPAPQLTAESLLLLS